MSRDDIIKLAQVLGTTRYTRQYADPLYCFDVQDLERFFHAAQKLEREECAKVAEESHPNDWPFIGSAIRNRSNDA